MLVLLDEMVPTRFRLEFSREHAVETVEYRGWKGIENGEILPLAKEAGFDCLITRDRGIPDQQNLSALGISVIVVRPRGQGLAAWRELPPEIERALGRIRPGEIVRVEPVTQGTGWEAAPTDF